MSKHVGSRLAAAMLAAALTASCGGGRQESTGPAAAGTAAATGHDATGQVAPPSAAGAVSYYAAFRFAEQASFGPTPALIAEIRAKGFEKWIDDQFALPPTLLDPEPAGTDEQPNPADKWMYFRNSIARLFIAAPDQLRARVVWSVSQYIVVVTEAPAEMHWINTLQRQVFSRYDDLLAATTLNPGMGRYLDNVQNRPKSAECPHCAPNENYARELMQLFTLGVIQLNPDGTPVRDNRGRYVETYLQTDVDELARVLTGWQYDPNRAGRPNWDWGNWGKPMVASTWPPERDSGEKKVLGRTFPAGQSTRKDLDDAIDMLMSHQNIAPFVSLRLIQHLVKSSPTPAYVGRVAAKFRNNGSGARGDMKAVIKAVLLDTEARNGDVPGTALPGDGKYREPVLHDSAIFRALGCTQVPTNHAFGYWLDTQLAFGQQTVFSFYAPTDRVPGRGLLAPEQRIVTGAELRRRLNDPSGLRYNPQTRQGDLQTYKTGGCQLDPLIKAYTSSPRAFNDYLSQAFFRGAMPPTLRSNLELLMREPYWDPTAPDATALQLMSFALTTPYFGVMK